MRQVISLIKKDILLELRQKHTFFGVLLYVGCTVFMIYMMAGQPEKRIWNALFWIAMLFITVNAVAKSFLQDSAGRARYYITIVHPAIYLIAKMVYSVLLMLFICIISLGLFILFAGNPGMGIEYLLVACSGALTLSILFTFLSSVAAQARQNAALMAILGFPIAIPVLMILSRLSLATISSTEQSGWVSLLLLLGGVDVLIIALGLILFPFLWKE